MSVSFRALIEHARQDAKPDLATLARQPHRTGKHHTPSTEDIHAAVASGDAGVVAAVVGAQALTDPQRKALATEGLQAWASNPLASRQAPSIVEVLLSQQADPTAKDTRGMTVLDKTLPMLSRIWEEEAKPVKPGGRPRGPTGSGTLLGQSLALIHTALGLERPVNLEHWRSRRSIPSSSGTLIPLASEPNYARIS